MRNDNLRTAKAILADSGIRALIKDMKSATFTGLLYRRHKGDWNFCHREEIVVTMKGGTVYRILRETVDSNGEFSEQSAQFITRSISTAF